MHLTADASHGASEKMETLMTPTGHTRYESRLLPALLMSLAVAFAAILAASPTPVLAEDASGDVTVWRLYNRWSGEHLFTTDQEEYRRLTSIGWNGEGEAWRSPAESNHAVWRLYNPYSGDHHYTADEAEYDRLGKIGWNQEGRVFFSADKVGGRPIYRLFNRWLTQGTHLFTTDGDEYKHLGEIGWSPEGVAFYALRETGGGDGGPYTVRFVSWDDEKREEVTVLEETLAKGEEIKLPRKPSRTDADYEFRGWEGIREGMRCTGDYTSRALWAPTAPASIEAGDGVVVSDLRFTTGVACAEGQVEWLSGSDEAAAATSDHAEVRVRIPSWKAAQAKPGGFLVVNRNDLVYGAALLVEDVSPAPDNPFESVITGRVPDELTDVVDSISIDACYDSSQPFEVSGRSDEGLTFEIENENDGRLGFKAAVDFDKLGTSPKWDETVIASSFRRIASILDGRHTKGSGDTSQDCKLSVEGKTKPVLSFKLQRGEVPVRTMVLDDLDAKVTGVGKVTRDVTKHVGYLRIGPVIVDVDLRADVGNSFNFDVGIEGATLGYDRTGKYSASMGDQSILGEKVTVDANYGIDVDAIVGIYGIVSADADFSPRVKLDGTLENHADPTMTCVNLKVDPTFPATLTAMQWHQELSTSNDVTDGLEGVDANWHWEDTGSGLSRVPDCTWGPKAIFEDGGGRILKAVAHKEGDTLLDGAPHPTRDGYFLAGWIKKGDSADEPVGDDAIFTGRVTLVPMWRKLMSSGTFGKGCSWNLTDDGTLTVFPTDGKSGTMGRLWDAIRGNTKGTTVKSICVKAGVRAPENSFSLFCDVPATAIDAAGLDVSGVKHMEDMFRDCSSLRNVSGLSGWDTSHVTDMSQMFDGCSSLSDVSPLSGWDTSSVTKMFGMFKGCAHLASLSPLSRWGTSSVTDMRQMFYDCTSLSSLSPILGWDVSSVTDMSFMFSGCNSLVDVSGLSGWDTSSITNMSWMFYCCTSLSDLSPLSGWDTSSVTDMAGILSGCKSLSDLSPLSGWDTSSVTHLRWMFSGCKSLSNLSPLSGWDASSVTDMTHMFSSCTSLSDLSPLSGWNVSFATDMSSMFFGCNSLVDATPLESWKVSSSTNKSSMFPSGCKTPSWYTA